MPKTSPQTRQLTHLLTQVAANHSSLDRGVVSYEVHEDHEDTQDVRTAQTYIEFWVGPRMGFAHSPVVELVIHPSGAICDYDENPITNNIVEPHANLGAFLSFLSDFENWIELAQKRYKDSK